MCTTLGKIRVESTLTDNHHTQTSEGRLVNKKVTIIPLYGDKKFGSVPPREGRESRVHPDLVRRRVPGGSGYGGWKAQHQEGLQEQPQDTSVTNPAQQ